MRYLTSLTKQRLKEIVNKLNNTEKVTLSERILLNKYASRIPYINTLIKRNIT